MSWEDLDEVSFHLFFFENQSVLVVCEASVSLMGFVFVSRILHLLFYFVGITPPLFKRLVQKTTTTKNIPNKSNVQNSEALYERSVLKMRCVCFVAWGNLQPTLILGVLNVATFLCHDNRV